MLNCVLFGAFVLGVIGLVPLGAGLLRGKTAAQRYQYTLFAIYGGGVLWLTLVNRWGMEVSNLRLKPFYVLRQLAKCGNTPTAACHALLKNSRHLLDSAHATPVEDLLLNIILFMPLGFLLPYIWPKLNFWKTALIGLGLSTCIEITQYVAHLGCCDIDDILNNTFGACIGYACYAIYKKCFPKLFLV